MKEGYVSVKEMATSWKISTRSLQIMCTSGKIPGAVKNGRIWEIPEGTERPVDGRVTTGKYRNWRNRKKAV